MQTEGSKKGGWKRKAGQGCGIVVLLLILAAAAIWIWKPWVPKLEVAEPGAGGERVAIGTNPANYFAPAPGKASPAILLVGGSKGGLTAGGAQIAKTLQDKGYAVLQLSYFRAPGQPQDLVGVPVETFTSAIDWLKQQPGVDPQRIGLIGGSKGAEALLLVASMRPDVKAVVAGMPSSVVWPGFSWTGSPPGGSTWTLNGKDVPALPYGEGSFSEGMSSIYVNGLKDAAKHPDTAIAIEKSPAQVMLICGEQDSLWPSCPMARQLTQRDPRITLLAYPDAGHAVFGRPRPDGEIKGLGGLGGTDAGNNAARNDAWPKMMAFLDTSLGVAPPPGN